MHCESAGNILLTCMLGKTQLLVGDRLFQKTQILM